MADWRMAYLSALGAKPTPATLSFLAKWQPWEGGATHNDAHFNYFNTTENMPGARSINSVGVKAYPNLAVGAQAFAKTLLGRAEYAPLVDFLRTGKGDPTPGLSEWVSGSPDSAHGLAYAAKILGSHPGNLGLDTSAPSDNPQLDSPTAPTPLTVSGVSPTAADAAASGAAQIRSQAIKGFGDIATGAQSATESFGDISGLVHALHAAKIPTIHPETQALVQADPNGTAAQAVRLAQKYIGVKYTWGGTNAKTGFDCSGLVQSVWKQLGVNIPRTTYAQWDAGTAVKESDLKPGDEVFFTGSDPMNGKPGHEGLYIGNGQFIEAPGSGMHVRVSKLAGRTDYVGARRFA